MPRIIKENSTFLSWVVLPTLLLIASILGVNLVSRPLQSNPGDTCSGSTFNCINDNSLCVNEQCNTLTSECEITSYNTGGNCGVCNDCGNGRCEPTVGENTATCLIDCTNVPNCGPNTPCNPNPDQCCPGSVAGGQTCQGHNPADPTTFDPDCCSTCGLFPGECVPGQCPDPAQTCDTVTCQCTGAQCGDGTITPPETCDDGNAGTQGCSTQGSGLANACRAPGSTSGGMSNQCTCCGDGNLDAGETCDPGGPLPDPTCDKICRPFTSQCTQGCTPTAADCAAIDPNLPLACCAGVCQLNAAGAPFCTFFAVNGNCPQPGPNCGNGVVDAGETCDHGALNGTAGDDCGFNCLPNVGRNPPTPLCGNGITEAPEQCDSGTVGGDATCTANCTLVADVCILEGGCLGSDSGPDICANLMGTPAYQALQFARSAWWVGIFAVPGALYAGIRLRRRKK